MSVCIQKMLYPTRKAPAMLLGEHGGMLEVPGEYQY